MEIQYIIPKIITAYISIKLIYNFFNREKGSDVKDNNVGLEVLSSTWMRHGDELIRRFDYIEHNEHNISTHIYSIEAHCKIYAQIDIVSNKPFIKAHPFFIASNLSSPNRQESKLTISIETMNESNSTGLIKINYKPLEHKLNFSIQEPDTLSSYSKHGKYVEAIISILDFWEGQKIKDLFMHDKDLILNIHENNSSNKFLCIPIIAPSKDNSFKELYEEISNELLKMDNIPTLIESIEKNLQEI